MEQLPKQNGRHLEPWEVFDMIGGTSTGGLVLLSLRVKLSTVYLMTPTY
jgi:patatin-like phospholipase/acyl hydrolase